MKEKLKQVRTHVRKIRIRRLTKKQLLVSGGVLLAIIIIGQLLYPTDRLLPFAKLDSVAAGGWTKSDAVWELENRITKQDLPVYRGEEDEVYLESHAADIGIEVDAEGAVKEVDYPWYMRLVPSSLLWYGNFQAVSTYEYSFDEVKTREFIKTKLSGCNLAPQNASLEYRDKALHVLEANNGGQCEASEVITAADALRPVVSRQSELKFPATITEPKVTDEDAEKLKTELESFDDKLILTAADKEVAIGRSDILSWLVFDNSKDALKYSLDKSKTDKFFGASVTPMVSATPGITRVTTRDFTEVSRTNGAMGRTLNSDATRQSILEVLKGDEDRAVAVTTPVTPKVEYTRTYSSSDTGISALIQQFSQDNPGTYGVQYIEMNGKKRRAGHNESQKFITASTYKLYVAYSTLKRVESGKWKWNDQVVNGQNLSTCFDKMIANSDNPCAEALYSKIGYQAVINEARALGLNNTVLDRDGQKTSAGDLATFLGGVYSGTIDINADSRSRLINAMKRNVFRQGIPAGANGTVADKVGFLNGLFHDASIVYSGRGDYVLVVMTDGASWGKIAELTRKLESIR